MKIKRFFSQDMRNVIRMVREELGADAVILSNSRVSGGVEVIAAIDYDESLLDREKPSKRSHHSELASSTDNNKSNPNTFSASGDEDRFTPSSSRPLFDAASKTQENKGDPIGGSPKSASSTIASLEKNPFESTVSKIAQRAEPRPGPGRGADDGFKFTLLDDSDSIKTDPIKTDPIKTDPIKTTPTNKNSDKWGPDSLGSGDVRISETLFEPPARDREIESPKRDKSNAPKPSVWSQEPTLVDMRNEIKTLRGLVEQQLTGLAWGDMARRNPVRAKLIRQLLQLDISPILCQRIADALPADGMEHETAWPHAMSLFASQLPIYSDDVTATGGVVAVLGATGVGKTTTIAKMAARYALKQGRNKLALVTTDSFRIAAHEQLRTYGRILDIPVRVAKEKSELVDILNSFSDKELVLIDTAGMGQRDIRLSEQFSLLADSAPLIKTFIALSTTTHRAGLEEIVKAFSGVQLHGCILTKIDETTNLGGALSVALLNHLPIAYVSDGQKVPEDFHLARAYNLISRAVSIAEQVDEPLQVEAVELAFNGMLTNVGI